MQIDSDGRGELTYCTNIHPGESLEEVESNLQRFTIPIKERVSPDAPFGTGLWLSNASATTLMEDEGRLRRFSDLLAEHQLYVFTLNGFPYGSFHGGRVKDDVYRPDWREEERLDYSKRLVHVLHALLPSEAVGSISTSPLSYKPWLPEDADVEHAMGAGARRLADLAFSLHDLRDRTGRLIHFGIEPEPDCLIENTAETVDFYEEWLLLRGGRLLEKDYGLSRVQAEDALREHIRLCYDTCHFAVEFEGPELVLNTMRAAGIRLSKVQISAALRVPLAGSDRTDLRRALEPFAESTYLHQVVARTADGDLHRYPDLPEALPHIGTDHADEWRIHYHVPIFENKFEDLYSTQDDILPVVERVLEEDLCRHLEIETYTWDVLPSDMKSDVVTSIEREFHWMLGHLRQTA